MAVAAAALAPAPTDAAAALLIATTGVEIPATTDGGTVAAAAVLAHFGTGEPRAESGNCNMPESLSQARRPRARIAPVLAGLQHRSSYIRNPERRRG